MGQALPVRRQDHGVDEGDPRQVLGEHTPDLRRQAAGPAVLDQLGIREPHHVGPGRAGDEPGRTQGNHEEVGRQLDEDLDQFLSLEWSWLHPSGIGGSSANMSRTTHVR